MSTGQLTKDTKKSVLRDMADRYGMESEAFEATIRATVMPKDSTREQLAAFLLVAKEYGLNPLTKEIFAFAGKGGGVQPIVSIDGWLNLANSHPAFDGMEFEDHIEQNGLVAITCTIHRKDRNHPITVTEYMAECKGPSDVWKRWPARMLRHKAAIQAIRYAFGFAGLMDEDEYRRMIDVQSVVVQSQPAKANTLAKRLACVPEIGEAYPEQEPAESVEEVDFEAEVSK